MPRSKQKKHMMRLLEIRAEKAKARQTLNASGVTSWDGCDNKAVPQQGTSSSVKTSEWVKQEGHGADATVTSDEYSSNDDRVPATTTSDKNVVGEQLADGEEVAIPVIQLKSYMNQARVIDKPTPKPKRVVPLKPRPRFPSPSFCFVCVIEVDRSTDIMSNVTKTDCYFLLKEMLELSKLETDHYMDRLKEPETLIGLCVNCLEVIREAVKLKKQISELEMGLKIYQRQIVKAIKGTELNSFSGKCSRPMEIGAMREKSVAIENLLRFVYKRKYFSVLSGRAPVGKKKDPRSGLDDFKKEPNTVTSAPAHDIKAGRSQPISHIVQKKSKTIPPGKSSWIIPGPNKKMYLARPKFISKTSGKQPSTVILKPASGEVPILNFNQCKDLSKDPLALDDEIEDIFWQDSPNQKPGKIECEPEIPNPPIPSVSSSPAPTRYLICGLCKDDKIYESGAQLQLHTNKVHGPPNPQPQPPKQIPSLTKSPDKNDKTTLLKGSITSSSRLEGEKRGSIINRRKIIVHPTRTKPPLKTYSRKQSPPNSGNEVGNNIFSPEDNAIPFITKWSSYDCPLCPAVKDYGLNRFLQHLAIHQRRPYRCTVCSQLFPEDEAVREAHWKDKHSDAPIPSTSSPLEPREKFVKLKLTPGQIWKCDGCRSAFITEEGRDNHEIKCSVLQEKSLSMSTVCNTPMTPIQCSTCKKYSRSMEEWRLHRAIHYPEINRTCCIFCDKSFVEKTVDGFDFRRHEKMVEHIQKDHKGLPQSSRIFDDCESCGVVFNMVAESEAHFLEVHGIPIGERKFSCPICQAKIVKRSYLSVHIKKCHFRKEPLICDICGVTFSQKNQDFKIIEHKLQKHGILPEGRKLHYCLEKGCQFKTAIKKYMTHHSQRDHGGARKYICKHCGKGFMDSSKLKQHELIHENQLKKPHQCEFCGNSFAIRNYLYIHKRLSHEGRRFPSTNQKRVARPSNQPPKRPRVAAAVTIETEGRPNEVVTPANELPHQQISYGAPYFPNFDMGR